MTVNQLQSDALVFFGATGDVAYRKIFPALWEMSKSGTLAVPVIGVAKGGWDLAQLRAAGLSQAQGVAVTIEQSQGAAGTPGRCAPSDAQDLPTRWMTPGPLPESRERRNRNRSETDIGQKVNADGRRFP